MNKIQRTAQIGVDGTNPDIGRNITVSIKIVGALPFVSMSQIAGKGDHTTEDTDTEDIRYNRAVASYRDTDVTLGTFVNTLVDKDDAARFTPLTSVFGIGSSSRGYIYHDEKYGDYILIPELRSLGDSDKTRDVLKNQSLEIEGFILGGFGDQIMSTFIMGADIKTMRVTPPPGQVTTRTHRVLTYDAKNSSRGDNYGVVIGPRYIESTSTPSVDFASLGASAGITGGGKVPAYRYVDVGIRSSYYMYVGMMELDDVLIPLPF